MVKEAHVECTDCGHLNVVVPPPLGFGRPEDQRVVVGSPRVPEGAHLVVADSEGAFTCAECGAEGQAFA